MLELQALRYHRQPPPLKPCSTPGILTLQTRGAGPGGGPQRARVRTTLMELILRPATPQLAARSAGRVTAERPASRRWLLSGLGFFKFPERHFPGFEAWARIETGHVGLPGREARGVLHQVGLGSSYRATGTGAAQRRPAPGLALAVQLVRDPAVLLAR